MNEFVILVDEYDRELGTMPKLETHEKGILHRAISVFIFNSRSELLLQKRAKEKYHSPTLWSNTSCSHPAPGESTMDAARRRLKQEMGMVTELKHIFSFIYKINLDRGLVENEFDHVFIGFSDNFPAINKDEVMDYKYISIPDLRVSLNSDPLSYSEWFKICIDKVLTVFQSTLNTPL